MLKEQIGLSDIYLEQYRTFGAINRINNTIVEIFTNEDDSETKEKLAFLGLDWFTKRFVSVGFYALVDINKVKLQKADFDESVGWESIESLPEMIMNRTKWCSMLWKHYRKILMTN